jgi:hypothetical protein
MALATSRVTAAATEVQCLAANGARLSYNIANRDPANIFIGPTGLTTATGYQISPGESFSVGGDTGAVFIIAAGAGTANAVHIAQVTQD